jgi:hypothetical protein
MSDRTPIDKARFQIEFMALMIQSGRGEDAATAYNRAHEYLTEAETELERLRELVPDTEPLRELLRR